MAQKNARYDVISHACWYVRRIEQTNLTRPLFVRRQVIAELTPTSSSAADVRFQEFTVGPLKVKASEKFKGAIDITYYVDDEVRITRGNEGNLFVLVRAAGLEAGFR